MSFFINGVPMTIGRIRPPDSRFTAMAEGLRLCGEGMDLAPPLQAAVEIFLARTPRPSSPFSEARLFGPPDIWIGRKRGEPGWERLDSLAQGVIESHPAALSGMERLLDKGLIAEMKMAMEMKAGPLALETDKRNRALLRLRDMELRFDAFRREPRRVPGNEKRERIALYLEMSRQMETPIENPESKLDLLFDLVQLHEFIHQESGLSKLLVGKQTPGYLTDLLNGELGMVPLPGACLPLAVLALHLGARIGLPLGSYYSEEHISLVAGGEDEFIYEPGGACWIFLPRNAYVRALCAPEEEPVRGPLLAVLSFPWESFLTEDNDRFGEYARFVAKTVATDLWVYWHLLATHAGVDEDYDRALRLVQMGLKLFPQCLPLWIKRVSLALMQNDLRNARAYLRQARVILVEREKMGGLAAPAEGDIRKMKRYAKQLATARFPA